MRTVRRRLLALFAAAPLAPVAAGASRPDAWSAASERAPAQPIAPQVEQYRLQVCDGETECRPVMRINADGSGAWFDWPAIEELAALPDDDGDRAQVKMLCHVALAARQAGKDGK